eukprot:10995137-Alexandrium_andersonii.AAC.1
MRTDIIPKAEAVSRVLLPLLLFLRETVERDRVGKPSLSTCCQFDWVEARAIADEAQAAANEA